MKENYWKFTFPESSLKTLKELNKIQVSASALAISQAWKATVPDYKLNGAFTALSEIVASQKAWREMILPTSSLSEMMAAAYPTLKVDVSSIAQSVLAQIDTSALDALRESVSMAALAKTEWSWLSEAYSEAAKINSFSDSTAEAEEVLPPDIRSQMAADITEVLSEPEKMHIASQNKYLKWAKESPEHALQFLNTLLSLIVTIFTALSLCTAVWQARTVKASQVYEEPTSKSNVVYNLTVENNVTVVGDVPYYYEVEFVNPETGELVTGYIYKGNVTIDEPSETEVQKEETEPTEESEPIPGATVSLTEPTE